MPIPTVEEYINGKARADCAAQAQQIPRIHEVVFDRSPVLPAAYESFDDLVILKQEMYYDYRKPPDYRKVYRESAQMIQNYPYERLKRAGELRDGPMMLELAVRSIVSCQAQDDPSFNMLKELVSLTGLDEHRRNAETSQAVWHGVNFQLRKCALAVLAWLNFQAHLTMDRDGSLHAVNVQYWMTNAAYYANILCWEGPIPPIVIRIATWLMTLNKRFGVDVRTMDGFDKLNALWRTYDDFMIWQSDREKERLKKISKAPNQYRCAADSCGIQAINKRALRRCGGRCPDETKPHYCSVECQERHWFVHQHACTQGLSSLPIMDDDSDPAWIDVKKYETKYPNAILPDWLVWSELHGAEIFIDFPHPGRCYKGDIIRVRSKTFGPEFLRSYRAMWQIPQYSRKFNESLIGRPFDGSAPSAPH